MKRFGFVSAALLLLSAACGAFERSTDSPTGTDAGLSDGSVDGNGGSDVDGGEGGADAGPPRTLLVLGGEEGAATDRTFYGTIEPSGIRWTEGARLPNRWSTGCARSFGDTALIASGMNGSVLLDSAQQTGADPLATWKSVSGLSKPRRSAGCVDLPNGLVVVGGGTANSTSHFVEVDVATPADGGIAWRAGPPLPVGRQDIGTVYADNHVYAAGGFPCTKNILSWDPSGQSGWQDAGSLPINRYGAAVASSGKRIFVIGGLEGTLCNTATLTPSIVVLTVEGGGVKSVTSEGVLPEARHLHRAVVVGSNLYVLGGRVGPSITTTSVLRAPIDANGVLGAWVSDTPLPTGLAGFALGVR